ncbi:MAG: 2-phospho-L-lactate transferase [Thermofilum sp. ex4484_82]|nr:MAG: 2-phospho-L-lactate transferase [Thermofilum sp. ex4484_82]OYT35661.1 MAG: 2-phospho-L-lactate transferase [Archaeoglobales archaeon ex4484_92]
MVTIVNTGDDIEFYGLHISPDVDIVTYTLAGIVDEEKGWGIRGDTFNCLDMLRKYGYETWFMLGDKDLATHIHRTLLLKSGLKLSEVTEKIRKALGVKVKIIPMTNDKVQTKIVTNVGEMHFQEYLVKRKAQDPVLDVKFEGIERAEPAPGVIEAILNADGIIICPSNPIVSIGPILSIKGVKEALKKTKAKIVAISPIVGGAPIKGPADKLMRGLGIEVSALGVAKIYKNLLDMLIIDNIDRDLKPKIEEIGVKVHVTNTIMKTIENKIKLAKEALNCIGL